MVKLVDAPLDQDLQALSVYWWQQKMPHKIAEQAGRQCIYVQAGANGHDSDLHQAMREDYAAFSEGRLQLTLQRKPKADAESWTVRVKRLVQGYPVTWILIALSVVGFLLVEFGITAWVDLLRIQAVDDSALARQLQLSDRISPAEFLSHGQYWRLITPVFLHFGWVHIVFNMLWLWELGRRIEVQGGALHLASIVFFIGVASNLYQAASTPYAYFGGMSGVIYGLLGYCAVFNSIVPSKALELPRAVYVIMLLSLLVGWLSIFDFLAQMANVAHFSGLLWGGFIALPSALIVKYWPANSS